jgi:uncharacterized protein (DUF427 family)
MTIKFEAVILTFKEGSLINNSINQLITKPVGNNFGGVRCLNIKQKIKSTMKAIWNGKVIAESEDTVVVEGNHYFPVDSINMEYFKDSSTNTVCPWKGTASYYLLDVEGNQNPDAAWYYQQPSELAKGIKDHVAFWKGVEVAN